MDIPTQIQSAGPLCQGMPMVVAQNMKSAEQMSKKNGANFALD